MLNFMSNVYQIKYKHLLIQKITNITILILYTVATEIDALVLSVHNESGVKWLEQLLQLCNDSIK